MKIVAAIPHYNMPATLKPLIERLLHEGFDAIYVLDDASVPAVRTTLGSLTSKVNVVLGDRNLGAGGNRNRILDYIDQGIVFFIDADMELKTTDVCEKIQRHFKNSKVAVTGYKILAKDGRPMQWNFGSEIHPLKLLEVEYKGLLAATDGKFARQEYDNADPYFLGLNPLRRDLSEQSPEWVSEGIFAISAEIFKQVGGYDPQMRYHETQDLCHRIRSTGSMVNYSPNIVARHLEVKLGGVDRRYIEGLESEAYFYKKHYGISREFFDWIYKPLIEKRQRTFQSQHQPDEALEIT